MEKRKSYTIQCPLCGIYGKVEITDEFINDLDNKTKFEIIAHQFATKWHDCITPIISDKIK